MLSMNDHRKESRFRQAMPGEKVSWAPFDINKNKLVGHLKDVTKEFENTNLDLDDLKTPFLIEIFNNHYLLSQKQLLDKSNENGLYLKTIDDQK
ncbi:22717_t:CDS:2 [Gigaspora margarita]|uniref:22717_t:CDS:1 n=1 Tax=Gigaspora margarita TaxID=4874 RepID=A0ABM8W7E9_GIGMA|nr:22717_t:CDS:2 [Gigaspora margarita]